MRYRRMGHWGLEISAISLGGWTTYGGSVNDERMVGEILARGRDRGINFYDMADVYARGEAERIMGRVLSAYPRHTLVLSSKVFFPASDEPNDRGLSRKHVHESIRRSLKRIGTDYLDLYFAHRFDPDVPLDEIVRAFSDLVDQGLTLYWGTSEWPADAVRDAIALAREAGWHAPAVEQPHYSLLHRARVEGELLPLVRETGSGVVVWSPLGQGVLTGKYDSGVVRGSRLDTLPQFSGKLASERSLSLVRGQMRELALQARLTRAQLALAWVLSRPEITSAIVGATRVEQLEENLGAADVDLDAEVVRRLDLLFSGNGL